MKRVKLYYRLAKPGIVYGNSFALIAGFVYASQGEVDWLKLLIAFVSTGLIIGSACVFNNILESETDAKMTRTKDRATASGAIKPTHAYIYGLTLGTLGLFGLIAFTNYLAVLAAFIGLLGYIIYTFSKSKTHHSTLIGTLPGATPPLIGYFAVTPQLDVTALFLFLILALWQMPHFYSIAIRRKADYKAAGLPVLSVTKGENVAINQSTLYGWLFIAVLVTFYFYEQLSPIYGLIILFSLFWLWQMYKYQSDYKLWAKKIFITSLNVLMLWSIITALEGFL